MAITPKTTKEITNDEPFSFINNGNKKAKCGKKSNDIRQHGKFNKVIGMKGFHSDVMIEAIDDINISCLIYSDTFSTPVLPGIAVRPIQFAIVEQTKQRSTPIRK